MLPLQKKLPWFVNDNFEFNWTLDLTYITRFYETPIAYGKEF